MASLSHLKSGRWVVQFCSRDDVRKTVHLGGANQRQADTARLCIEDMEKWGESNAKEATRAWLAGLPDDFWSRLERVGLVGPRPGRESISLAAFIRGYIDLRAADAKPNTLSNYEADYSSVSKYFGNKLLGEITPDDAEAFRSYLKAKPLSEATVRRRCKRVKQFFKAAIKRKLVVENPFADIVCSDYANSDRQRFVSRDEIEAVFDACPDAQWRLIVALCRYGGLRCPSEPLVLTWADVDWEKRRFRVHASKTEHHADGGNRIVPIFPELYPYLMECFEQAQGGEKYVITRYRDSNQNLRTQLKRIIGRAGLEPWPRLFHNQRASRQTELEQDFPGYVVAKWMGNSESIAWKHYLMLTEGHYLRAVQGPGNSAASGAAQNAESALHGALQQGAAPNRTESHRIARWP